MTAISVAAPAASTTLPPAPPTGAQPVGPVAAAAVEVPTSAPTIAGGPDAKAGGPPMKLGGPTQTPAQVAGGGGDEAMQQVIDAIRALVTTLTALIGVLQAQQGAVAAAGGGPAQAPTQTPTQAPMKPVGGGGPVAGSPGTTQAIGGGAPSNGGTSVVIDHIAGDLSGPIRFEGADFEPGSFSFTSNNGDPLVTWSGYGTDAPSGQFRLHGSGSVRISDGTTFSWTANKNAATRADGENLEGVQVTITPPGGQPYGFDSGAGREMHSSAPMHLTQAQLLELRNTLAAAGVSTDVAG